MPQLIWTPQALADVQRLYHFLAQKIPPSAQRTAKAIRAGVKTLAHQPNIGRPIEDMDTEYWEWPIEFGSNGYVALYHFDGETDVILAVRHQKEAGYE